MSTLLGYVLPGIPYGCDFALMAVGLVITFRTTGVFNLAFGAQAFGAAFVFDLLVRSEGLPVWLAFVLSVLVLSPAVGLVLDRFLFSRIATTNMTAKIVSSVGLLIAIPQLLPILFGGAPRENPPSLWLDQAHVEFRLFGTSVNGSEVSTTVITLGAVAALLLFLRLSPAGLEMRAVVESRRLAQLQGIDSGKVAASAWALSSVMAGLAGVLLLPLSNVLNPTNPLQFTGLLVAGLTAAALARMRSIGVALGAAIGLGVAQEVLELYFPNGALHTASVNAFPFIVLVGTLVGSKSLRSLGFRADPMAGVDPPPPPPSVSIRDPRLEVPMKWGFRALIVAFVVSGLTWVPGYWVTPLDAGLVYSTIFLSVTLITGASGQLSLCQATFAGVGAFAAGQLAAHFGLPVLLGAVVGGLMAAAVGAVLALLAARISGLILTLLTLAFALMADTFLFQYSWSGGSGTGVSVPRPVMGSIDFTSNRAFLVLALLVLLVCILLVALVQRGTTGRFLAAMRGSEPGAASLGINLLRARVTVFAMSAGIAGVGGAMFGSLYSPVSADSFVYEISLAFVVVVITTGSRRIEGAVQAGMSFAIIQFLFTYAPPRFQGLTPILFAFGALNYAQHPEGMVEYQKTRWMMRVSRLLARVDARRGTAPAALAAGAGNGTAGGVIGSPGPNGAPGLAGSPVGLSSEAVSPRG